MRHHVRPLEHSEAVWQVRIFGADGPVCPRAVGRFWEVVSKVGVFAGLDGLGGR